MIISLIGPPLVGKSTVGSYLDKHYNIKHISTGELIREEIQKRTHKGLEYERLLQEGQFVSDNDVNSMVFSCIQRYRNLVIDGYPRTVEQVNIISNYIDYVIYLDSGYPYLEKRMLNRKRFDDTPEIFKVRVLKYFELINTIAAEIKKLNIKSFAIEIYEKSTEDICKEIFENTLKLKDKENGKAA